MAEPQSDMSSSDEEDYESSLDSDNEDINDSDMNSSDYDMEEEDLDDARYIDSSNDVLSAKGKSDNTKPGHALWAGDKSLSDLMEIREKVGIKKFNKNILKANAPKQIKKSESKKIKKTSKRHKKHAPSEISSKKKAPFIRKVISAPKSKQAPRDPRFDDLCGMQFDEETFNKSYSFLDDIRERETEELKKMLKETENPYRRRKIRYLLQRMKNQQEAKKYRRMVRDVENDWWKEELEKVEKGIKKPYHLTKKKKKELLEAKKLEMLKESGKLDKAQARKEKRTKSKEFKRMPKKRRTVEQS